MSEISAVRDCTAIEVPMDVWTQPFWDAAAAHELRLCRCAECGHYRWPPGPFCPECHAQALEWTPAGPARIYTFTLIPQAAVGEGQAAGRIVPALIEFPEAGGVRLMSSIVDTPIDHIAIGTAVEVAWQPAANATVPVFKVAIRPRV
jgi:uncharacterized OB-fold protein